MNRQQGHLAEAERNFRKVLEDSTRVMRLRGFDFSKDYEVINLLGLTLLDRANQEIGASRRQQRESFLQDAVLQFEKTLALDSENVTAHHNLKFAFEQLGDSEKAQRHERLHARYKPDDNARDRAVALARKKYPAANHAAEALVIYDLQRNEALEAARAAAQRKAEVPTSE